MAMTWHEWAFEPGVVDWAAAMGVAGMPPWRAHKARKLLDVKASWGATLVADVQAGRRKERLDDLVGAVLFFGPGALTEMDAALMAVYATCRFRHESLRMGAMRDTGAGLANLQVCRAVALPDLPALVTPGDRRLMGRLPDDLSGGSAGETAPVGTLAILCAGATSDSVLDVLRDVVALRSAGGLPTLLACEACDMPRIRPALPADTVVLGGGAQTALVPVRT